MRRAVSQLGRHLVQAAERQLVCTQQAPVSLLLQQQLSQQAATLFPQMGATARHQAFATNSHDVFNQHKDTPDNNAEVPYEWTPVS